MTEPIYDRNTIRGPDDFAAVFEVSRETIDRLAIYEALLRQWQKTINLVAPGTLDTVWHRHFADSAQLAPLAPHARTWVDLGSGAGFPGLVVAIMLANARGAGIPSPLVGEGQGGGEPLTSDVGIPPTPNPSPRRVEDTPSARWGGEIRITLIESNARKCAFLREVVRRTGIGGNGIAVDILSTRIELAATQTSLQAPDVVSARALAPLDRLLNLAAPLFAASTVGLFLKGQDAPTELGAAEKMWDFNAELIPSRTDPGGRIIVIRNLAPRLHTKGKTKD